MNIRAMSFLVMSTIVCIVAPQSVHAVSPPPDGGYAGDNTAEGTNALFSLTTGVNNTAVGFEALSHDKGGSHNTATGVLALGSNTSGIANTATGLQALFKNTVGIRNTADGVGALFFNNNGSYSTATGWAALFNNTSGVANTADGAQALFVNTTGIRNTGEGAGALLHNNGNNNTAIGWSALFNNTTGSGNVAVGVEALRTNTTAGAASPNGANTAVGSQALFAASGASADGNTAVGYHALTADTTGGLNTAVGALALKVATTGIENTACGWHVLENVTTGSDNTGIGTLAGHSVTTASGVTCLGANVDGENVSNTTWIANVYNVTTQSGTTLPVVVSNNGQLGTAASSARFKKDIKPMQDTSEAILQLRPVTFHYKSDTEAVPQFGLVAEEVEKVDPDLVVKDKDGKVFTVRYDAVNAMLLNEFLKEHRKVQEQQATIAELKNDVGALVARIKEQDRKIQKVSDQVELNQAATRPIASQR
ncbi:MAG TPA: tail fiber domain-containing protein [Chthoniobacterales bacterium]|nr:tail fiber domain-containing protein [Chthoniobacterales bacterium]